jgi:hypothetical protein
MLTVSGFRMLNGTNLLRWFEFTLSAIDGQGLDIDEMLVLSNTLFAYARGHAASEIGEREAGVRSGMSRVDWMTERAESVRSIVESERFPYFNRIVKDAATPHREAMEERGFREGLECVLDGFAAAPQPRRNVYLRAAWEHEGWQPVVDLLLVPSLRDEMLTLSNFTGHPSLTLRAGFVEVAQARSDWAPDPAHPLPTFSAKRSVPHGICLIGRLFDDGAMGTAGMALERAFGVADKRPSGF